MALLTLIDHTTNILGRQPITPMQMLARWVRSIIINGRICTTRWKTRTFGASWLTFVSKTDAWNWRTQMTMRGNTRNVCKMKSWGFWTRNPIQFCGSILKLLMKLWLLINLNRRWMIFPILPIKCSIRNFGPITTNGRRWENWSTLGRKL